MCCEYAKGVCFLKLGCLEVSVIGLGIAYFAWHYLYLNKYWDFTLSSHLNVSASNRDSIRDASPSYWIFPTACRIKLSNTTLISFRFFLRAVQQSDNVNVKFTSAALVHLQQLREMYCMSVLSHDIRDTESRNICFCVSDSTLRLRDGKFKFDLFYGIRRVYWHLQAYQTGLTIIDCWFNYLLWTFP